MTVPNARSATYSGTGVLELLRLFKSDQAAADQYAAGRLDAARSIEPVLRAFEYLPVISAALVGAHVGLT